MKTIQKLIAEWEGKFTTPERAAMARGTKLGRQQIVDELREEAPDWSALTAFNDGRKFERDKWLKRLDELEKYE